MLGDGPGWGGTAPARGHVPVPWVGREGGALIETDTGRLEALACALAGDTAGAAELLAAARIATARPARHPSPESELDTDPDAEARAALVRAHLRRRREPAAAPREPLPEPELEEVRRRLAALAPLPRAVLVLRHLEQLTLADLTRLTDRGAPAVARALETATTAVGATGYQLDLVVAAVPVPEPGAVETARRRLEARRRRLRGRGVLVALVLAALATTATVLPGVLRPDPYTRAAGAWVYGYEVRPGTGLRVVDRFLTASTDTVRLIDEDSGPTADERRTCDLSATSSDQPVEAPDGRPTRVNGFTGRFLPSDGNRGAELWWTTGPGLALVLSCSGDSVEADLLAVAAMVAPTEVPVLVPVDLSDLPDGEEVSGIYDLDGQLAVLVLPTGETPESPNAVYVSVGTLFGATAQGERTVRVGGVTARVQQDAESETICWDLGGPQACVADFAGDEGGAAARRRQFDRLLTIARVVQVAPGGTDRSTWFDAREAVPG
ncbi:DNA-directed RNA polymerase specialized sigma subunit, sigma24 family [Friedmanniella luteola]|uniref:DNA-directed RNA polymerase specialized sigma subunit, sigma24 family n=1 Tax=Friedmanniella luteola TaxID=546871 RepID=A0A1H1R6H4_9ACTN|nr:hypothetical protein [Friedmanniella luteola]SDS31414.1 DNA-directed RNA polymerase specialized sigma subunit, sigma24 family [Friedmanniella luteola]